MFLVNSRGLRFCVTINSVPLIVKLLRTTCRVPLQLLALRLSILYLRTCVGLGYGSLNIKILSYSKLFIKNK
jgi:hypothetical protein